MEKILVRSLYDAFEYVMEHLYIYGKEEFSIRKDTYAVISIQDSYVGGFGFQFSENKFCKGVLTLLVDDRIDEEEKVIIFNEEHAVKIIDFIEKYKFVDSLLIHCYGGQSRSMAVGAFAAKMLGKDNGEFFENCTPNMHIYNILNNVFSKKNNFLENNKEIIFDFIQNKEPNFTRLCEISRLLEENDGKDMIK